MAAIITRGGRWFCRWCGKWKKRAYFRTSSRRKCTACSDAWAYLKKIGVKTPGPKCQYFCTQCGETESSKFLEGKNWQLQRVCAPCTQGGYRRRYREYSEKNADYLKWHSRIAHKRRLSKNPDYKYLIRLSSDALRILGSGSIRRLDPPQAQLLLYLRLFKLRYLGKVTEHFATNLIEQFDDDNMSALISAYRIKIPGNAVHLDSVKELQ